MSSEVRVNRPPKAKQYGMPPGIPYYHCWGRRAKSLDSDMKRVEGSDSIACVTLG
jgi:hypothetical protein